MTESIVFLGRENLQRRRLSIRGVVQGVGFRPFVYRLAHDLNLKGWVNNSQAGVTIEVEGPEARIKSFLERLPRERPAHSYIQSLLPLVLDPVGFVSFEIRASDTSEAKTAFVLPDMATCPECLKEVFDPNNRRYLYPFTNCTHCGPRYSIIEALPYDRKNTSMKIFRMCPLCRGEYEDPADRRFHTQPNACLSCGPRLEFWDNRGEFLVREHAALSEAVAALKAGKIVAVKGLGGFHLMVDAQNEESVKCLRERKHRERKPLALMFPSLEMIEAACRVCGPERALLLSSEAPIVLLKKKDGTVCNLHLADSVAPGNPYLGAMLPYTPLHHILTRAVNGPVVATSGNLSDEPICIDEREAVARLAGIADCFLVHNRPIVRPVDDSVVRMMMGRPSVLRRSRGYAPLPVSIQGEGPCVLATGAHLKNTIALSVNGQVFMSQHIGDLETAQSHAAFQETVRSFKELYEPIVAQVACDRHPEYLSTKFALDADLPVVQVQHHHAHIVSCMAENHLEGTVLGIAWDGTGYGDDQTIWGGEFLKANLTDFVRAGRFRTFRLPGGEKAIREPRRTALGLLAELGGDDWKSTTDLPALKSFSDQERTVMGRMLQKGFQAPVTSSVGRLFDAVASLTDVAQVVRFEGEAAMTLEFLIGEEGDQGQYPFDISQLNQKNLNLPQPGGVDTILVVDWGPMMRALIQDVRRGAAVSRISVKFHNTLVEMAVAVAKRVQEKRVVLSGGCFQNKYLTERMIQRLREEGFSPYWHQFVPPNDGGISLGQAVVGVARLNRVRSTAARSGDAD
ncbi:MAG: carbamoyltransferase HypF [Omnitrophica WOR_2 bacterium GWA2_45_18]|nr:MAG: carbamoyltransferase HypF [Omnitrophica WOR_2 bacterium GWA2_45_18]